MNKQIALLSIILSGLVTGGCYSRQGPVTQRTVATGGHTSLAISQTYTLYSDNGEFNAIRINLPIRRENVRIVESPNNEISISVSVLATTEERLGQYRNTMSHSINADQELIIQSSEQVYHCSLTQVNQLVYIDGTCLEDVIISLPRHSITQIYADGHPLVVGLMSVDDLINVVSDLPFAREKIAAITSFTQHARRSNVRIISINKLSQILEEIQFPSERLSAVRLFSGLVIDPENADQLAEHFSFQRELTEALNLAGR